MAEQGSGQSRWWVWAVVIVTICLGSYFLFRIGHSKVVVSVAEVERHDITSTVSTNGKVEPVEDFQAHAPFPGVVTHLYVHLNQQVSAGQELVRMDDADARRQLALAQANLISAEAGVKSMQAGGTQEELNTTNSDLSSAKLQLQNAAQSLSALEKLQAKGAASASEVASARQRLADDQLRVDQLQTRKTERYSGTDLHTQQAQVAQARAAVDAAQNALTNIDQRAPFAGTVYAVPVSQYDFVQAGESLLDVADLTKLQVRAYFDEPEIGKLAVGQPVKIVWDAKPGRLWHGHILEAPTTIISYGTRNVGECLISVDDAKGDLLPNTNVTVTVTTLNRSDVLSLPREALHTDGTSNYVFRVVNDRLVKTPIQVGTAVTLTRFEVTGGLKQGELVALGALNEAELTNGLAVKTQTVQR
jgi:HlyD family secretion protein